MIVSDHKIIGVIKMSKAMKVNDRSIMSLTSHVADAMKGLLFT